MATQDDWHKLALICGTIVLGTPKRSANSVASYVPRSLIAELEAQLNVCGYDMAAARKRHDDIVREQGGKKHGVAT